MSSDVKALAKRVAEGALTFAAALSLMTGFSQTELERLIDQGDAALDLAKKEQVARANRELEAAIRARNW